MSQGIHRKIRSDAVWAEVRKAWEDGETARSVARRYDVGVHALWKRREAEGWARPEPKAGPVEPAEGWGAYVQTRRDAFEARLADARALAEVLMGRGPEKDCGAYTLLRRYERARREDIATMQWATDGLQKLFSSPYPWLAQLGNLGLRMANSQQQLKNLLVRHAVG